MEGVGQGGLWEIHSGFVGFCGDTAIFRIHFLTVWVQQEYKSEFVR